MPGGWTRRRALLAGAGLAGAGLAGAGLVGLGLGSGPRRAADHPSGGSTRPPADLAATMAALVELPTEEAPTRAADWLAGGLPVATLLSAAFHAPIVYHCDESDLHGTLTAASAMGHLALDDRVSAVTACFVVERVAEWLLSPTLTAPPIRPSRASLAEAVAAHDAPAAEAAVMALDPEAGREALLAQAGFSLADPHRVIYVAHCLRGLRLFGSAHAQSVLRSVTRVLARAGPPLTAPALDAAVELAVASHAAGAFDPAAGEWLLSALRGPEPLEPMIVADAVQSGVSAATVEAAIAQAAAELLAADGQPSGRAVHGVTSTEALLAVAALSARPVTQWQARLRAAVAVQRLHHALAPTPPPADGPRQHPAAALTRAQRHRTDVHHLKCAAALIDLAPRVPPIWADRWRRAVAAAPVFAERGRWPRAPAVESRLAGWPG